MTSWPYSRKCRTASIRSGRAGGLAGELRKWLRNPFTHCRRISHHVEEQRRHPMLTASCAATHQPTFRCRGLCIKPPLLRHLTSCFRDW
jgi:hypothetical protein